MKRLLSMAMLAVLCAGNAGSAQEAGTGFQRAISVMPANVFHPGQVELASFLDLSLLTQLNDGQMGVTAFQRVGNVRGMTPLIALVRGGDEAWNKIGVDPARMDFFADFGQPPFSGVIWGFADQTVATSSLRVWQIRVSARLRRSPRSSRMARHYRSIWIRRTRLIRGGGPWGKRR